MLFSDLPEWTPAEPLVPRGNPAAIRVKYEPAVLNTYEPYQTQDNSSMYSHWALSKHVNSR